MNRPRHRPPPWWVRHRLPVSITAGALTVALVVAVAAAIGPRPHVDQAQPIAAAPTTEHTTGIKPWPAVTIPTIGAPGAWDPDTAPSTATVDRPATPTCSRCGQRSPATTTTSTAPSSAAAEDTGQEAAAAAADSPPAVAAELLALVNTDRAAAGCPPVTLHPSLDQQSQAHADQQAAADRMFHSDGVAGFDTWGENVAYGYDTAAAVHQGWMNSAGHRANILNCDFTWMGAAAADGASGRYWTEQFAA